MRRLTIILIIIGICCHASVVGFADVANVSNQDLFVYAQENMNSSIMVSNGSISANGNMTTNTTNNATSENTAMTDENTAGNISALNTKKFQASQSRQLAGDLDLCVPGMGGWPACLFKDKD